MALNVEDFSVDAIEWLKNVRFDEQVFGKPGQIILYSIVVLIWIYIVSWIYKDAEYRYFGDSKAKYVWLLVAVVAAPVAWFIYLILRPSNDLDDEYLKRVEERYLSFEARGIGYCAKCGSPVDPDYLFCQSCGKRVRSRCKSCDSLIETTFVYCPRCGKESAHRPRNSILAVYESEKADRLARNKMKKVKIQEKAANREDLNGKEIQKKKEKDLISIVKKPVFVVIDKIKTIIQKRKQQSVIASEVSPTTENETTKVEKKPEKKVKKESTDMKQPEKGKNNIKPSKKGNSQP